MQKRLRYRFEGGPDGDYRVTIVWMIEWEVVEDRLKAEKWESGGESLALAEVAVSVVCEWGPSRSWEVPCRAGFGGSQLSRSLLSLQNFLKKSMVL
ncbi:hypothetical protein C1H46_034873 [Malus baccata]|uniref:Uncharacterized protein n=1 Tax=Malus baccata TaxID=106549 RepID=A0A540KZD1_MALBA|nr:hypothetical protein C1H46_034873 [Malus baccata]